MHPFQFECRRDQSHEKSTLPTNEVQTTSGWAGGRVGEVATWIEAYHNYVWIANLWNLSSTPCKKHLSNWSTFILLAHLSIARLPSHFKVEFLVEWWLIHALSWNIPIICPGPGTTNKWLNSINDLKLEMGYALCGELQSPQPLHFQPPRFRACLIHIHFKM